MTTKYFTVADANTMLPWLREVVREMLHVQGQMNAITERIRILGEQTKGNGGGAVGIELARRQEEFKKLSDAMESLVKRAEEKGCILRDVEKSIIDFPSLRDGREVYLCWRLGEDKVNFWHEMDKGLAGRQPL